jgi:MraZ protein
MGRSEHLLDNKGRFNLPARFRDQLVRNGDNALVVVPWFDCLRLYPVSQWEETVERMRSATSLDRKVHDTFKYIVSGANIYPVDKQGRISLSHAARSECGIGEEVVAAGMNTYVEIWDRKVWNELKKPSREDFAEVEDALVGLGIG